MTDEARTSSLTPDGLCPWCSTKVKGTPERCPSCGASLRENIEATRPAEPQIPCLTEIDPALVRKPPPPRSRGLLAWITGDSTTEESGPPADPASIAPPSDDVRLEMLRLKAEALRADLEAEATAARVAAALDAAPREEAARAEDAAVATPAIPSDAPQDDDEPVEGSGNGAT
jgi:hypothetical protein